VGLSLLWRASRNGFPLAQTSSLLWIPLQLNGVSQQLAGTSNVSALAHLGGVAVGLVFRAMTKAVPKRIEDSNHESGLRRERY
jgi:membrane associated rhomboid family serine protease